MAYTLGSAAKATGKSKATISKAIATHRISATKNDIGEWQIDPAELHRVYPPQQTLLNDSAPTANAVNTNQTAEVERLKATVELLERLCHQIEGERDRLCRQIEGERDSLREQNIRLTALLNDQRAKTPEVIVTPPPARPEPAEPEATTPPAAAQVAPAKRKWWQLGGQG